MNSKRIALVAACVIVSALLLLTYLLFVIEGSGSSREWETSDLPLDGRTSLSGTYLYMALDSHDSSYVFVSWYLGMMVSDGGQWDTVPFEEPALYPGMSTCYTVDSEGKAHFVHYEGRSFEPKEIHYGTDKTGTWTLEVVDDVSRPDTGWWRVPMPRVVVDESGAAHLCYHSTASGHFLRYATNAGGSWEVTQILDAPHCDPKYSIALAPDGTPHICYWNYDTFQLVHVTRSDGVWTSDVIDDRWYGVNAVATEVMDDGTVSVVYSTLKVEPDDRRLSTMQCATNEGGSWTFSQIDGRLSEIDEYGFLITSVSADADSSGKIHVVYHKRGASDSSLIYATDERGSWRTETLVTSERGSYDEVVCALCVDSQDRVHIVYNFPDELKYMVGIPSGLAESSGTMDLSVTSQLVIRWQR